MPGPTAAYRTAAPDATCPSSTHVHPTPRRRPRTPHPRKPSAQTKPLERPWRDPYPAWILSKAALTDRGRCTPVRIKFRRARREQSIKSSSRPRHRKVVTGRGFRFQIGEPLGRILRFKQGYLTWDLGSAAVRAERVAFHKRPCPAWARHLRRSDLQSGQMPSTMTRDSAPGPLLWHRLRPVSFQIHRPLDAWRIT
jgi:hypothetical protein